MQTTKGFRLICAALLVSGFFYGCGNSNKTETIPTTATILYSHSVIFKNQSTYTMGYNGFGQLGDGTLENRAAATKIGGVGPMVKGVIGAEHTVVFGNDSSVRTWGYNYYGQLGDPAISQSLTTAFSNVPVKVPLHGIVTDIAAGGFHSLAIADGVVKAWGYNGYGQIGNDNTTNVSTPTPVSGTLPPAIQVAAGGTHSVALCNDGSVYTWGNGASGQLGFGNHSTMQRPRKVTAVPVSDLGGEIEKIAALGRATLALQVERDISNNITKERLLGWGYNGTGELGYKPVSANGDVSLTPVTVYDVPSVGTDTLVIEKIATGLNHILLLLGRPGTSPGDPSWTVKAIGYNYYGQLGNGKQNSLTGNNTSVSSFELVQTLMSVGNPLTGVTDIAAFGNHSFALVNGVWYGWGNNGLGQLGNPIATSTIGYFELPTPVQGL